MTRTDTSPPFLDAVTLRVIASKQLLDRVTPDSERARRHWREPRPLRDVARWQQVRDATRAVAQWWQLASHEDRSRVRRQLEKMPLDIERVLTRLELGERLGETDLFVLKRMLYHAHVLCDLAKPALGIDRDVAATHATLSEMLQALHPEREPSPRFHLSEALDADLADARAALTRARRDFQTRRKQLVAAHQPDYPGARFDLDGEVSLSGSLAIRAATDPGLVPHGSAWRLKDAQLDADRALVEARQDQVEQLETALRHRLSVAFSHHASWLGELVHDLTHLDLRLTRTRLLEAIDGCWPQISETSHIALESGRDPHTQLAQPVDFDMDLRPAIITGPNMGGKSSLLRLVGLCQWCLQHGLPAPAQAYSAPLLAHVVYVGSDEIHHDAPRSVGFSSFGREVRRMVESRAATAPVTLWLLDEVGRGTHPDDGAALATEFVHTLVARGDRVLFATHFPALAGLAGIQRWKIAGLVDRALLEQLADGHDLEALERALREAMDYRPVKWERGEDAVPRDARLIARLLGW